MLKRVIVLVWVRLISIPSSCFFSVLGGGGRQLTHSVDTFLVSGIFRDGLLSNDKLGHMFDADVIFGAILDGVILEVAQMAYTPDAVHVLSQLGELL